MSPDSVKTFESHRSLLEAIAYRMVGSLAEAQDIVQNTFLRWSKVDTDSIQSPKSWLVTTCSRIAMDILKSARVQRLEYVGPWLPEPILDSDSRSPDEQAQIDDTVSTALMLALEKLTAAERAAFLLHDIFDYSFEEVGQILQKSSAACRNLASRARGKIRSEKPKFEVTPDDHKKLLMAFLQASQDGNIESLKSILVESVELHSDGGGKAIAAREILVGNDIVSAFFAKVMARKNTENASWEIDEYWYNGAPGLVIYENGKPFVAFSLELESKSHRIQKIFALRNPDKLKPFEK